MAIESYKNKSKIATAISFIAAFITYIGQDGLTQIIPAEYAHIIPLIVLIAGYIVTQTTENRRVEVAEQIVSEKYNTIDPTEPILNDEYTSSIGGEDDDGHYSN